MIRKEKDMNGEIIISNVTADDSVGVGSARTSGISNILRPGRPGRSESS